MTMFEMMANNYKNNAQGNVIITDNHIRVEYNNGVTTDFIFDENGNFIKSVRQENGRFC